MQTGSLYDDLFKSYGSLCDFDIYGDLDLDLDPMLTQFVLFQLEDKPEVLCKFWSYRPYGVDARAHTEKQTDESAQRARLCESAGNNE